MNQIDLLVPNYIESDRSKLIKLIKLIKLTTSFIVAVAITSIVYFQA